MNNQAVKKIELPKKKKSDLSVMARLYIFPLLVSFGFILIVIFLIIPTLFSIFSTLDEVSGKNVDLQNQNQLLTQLRELNSNSSIKISQLNSVNNITTSDQTEVVRFRNRITDVILSNQLTIFSQSLTENDPDIISDGGGDSITLKEVPFTFKIEGSYTNIVNFFADLSVLSDFVIIKEMQFSRDDKIGADGTTIWTLDLVLVKYQFSTNQALDDVYRLISPSVEISQKVLDYINQRQ